ncbi:MAG: LysR family transcriptional regulator [Pseudomonadota bacterium]
MLIRHLHYFAVLSREEHFAKAAQICNVTQPTLSAALRKLEEDFGVCLVERDHAFFGLTSEGKRVLAWVQQILSDFDSLKSDLAERAADLTGTLKIGVIPAAMPITGFFTEHFLTAHPSVKIDLHAISSRQIQSGLDSLELHGGLTYLDNEPLERVIQSPLYIERYVVVSKRGHFPDGGTVPWQRLEHEPLCLLNEEMQNRRILDAAAHRNKVSLKAKITANSFLTICAHLRRGGWVSIVPETLLTLYGLEEDFDVHRIASDETRHTIGLAVPDRQPMAKMARALFAAVSNSDLADAFARANPSVR